MRSDYELLTLDMRPKTSNNKPRAVPLKKQNEREKKKALRGETLSLPRSG